MLLKNQSSCLSGKYIGLLLLLGMLIVYSSHNSISSSGGAISKPHASSHNCSDKTEAATAEAVPSQLAAGEMAISAPGAFNANSLQQQQLPVVEMAANMDPPEEHPKQHYNLDNKRPLDTFAGAATAAAFANAVLSMAAAARGNNTIPAAAVNHNGFHDKINTSNQRNEFNDRRSATSALADLNLNITVRTMTSDSESAGTFAPLTRQVVGASSYFERVELQESKLADKRQTLLLQRRKRYLIFPEGSSFQLVFDLIIPIVDYTNFAIMGITCAVAWELPSKPPSEIIENVRDKLNDGTFGLSRRNDTAAEDIKYITSQNTGVYTPVDGAPPGSATATAAPENSAALNSESGVRKPLTAHHFYNNPSVNAVQLHTNTHLPAALRSSTLSNSTHPPTAYYTQGRHNFFDAPDNFAFYDKSAGISAQSGPASYSTLNAHSGKNPMKYYKNSKEKGATGGYASADKRKFADWQRQRNKYYHNGPQSKYAGWSGKDNWWQRNQQRVQSAWEQKQHDWAHRTKQPPAATVGPAFAGRAPTHSDSRSGRARKILTAPPKHRIYPVFAKRRRRRRSQQRHLDALEISMERIHLREHLQTRQKLYGKIEKLYKVSGHNGTACVLRALCENGQRHHQHQQPQSFITELLRAIFALPKDMLNAAPHIERHYREAHAYAGNCAQRFAMCEHSLWTDLAVKL